MNDEQIIDEQITLKYKTKKDLEKIKDKLESAEEIRFKIETKHWYGYKEPFLAKDKDILNISKHTMLAIINEILDKINEKLDDLIKKRAELRGK